MISPSSFIIIEVLAQKVEGSEKKEEKESVKEKCISYNKPEKLISITCKYADFADVTRLITDPSILKLDTRITTNISQNNNEKVWLLYAGLKVEENADRKSTRLNS